MKVNSTDLQEATVFAMFLVDNLTNFSFDSINLEFTFEDKKLEKKLAKLHHEQNNE